MKTIIIVIAFAVMFGIPVLPHGISLEAHDPSKFENQVNTWIQTISQQTGFSKWKHARWTSTPLGPGTHGWVILISNQTEETGYLIVHSTPAGELVLSEYGNGNHPLFSINSLYPSLIRQEAVPAKLTLNRFVSSPEWKIDELYFHPFLALWKVTHVGIEEPLYLDAKTTDPLIITKSTLDKFTQNELLQSAADKNQGTVTQGHLKKIRSAYLLPSFDPYERINWIDQQPMPIRKAADITTALSKKIKVTFTATPFQDILISPDNVEALLIPYAVIGYHVWDEGTTYLAVDEMGLQEGIRYIPFPAFLTKGAFYK